MSGDAVPRSISGVGLRILPLLRATSVPAKALLQSVRQIDCRLRFVRVFDDGFLSGDRCVDELAFGAAVLHDKHNLVWFPEGGLSRTGHLMPLRPGIGMLLEHYRVTVVPVTFEGTR